MTIMTFGSKKPEHVTCERVEIGVAKDGVAIQLLSAFTVPMICEPLTRPLTRMAVQHLEYFKELKLADGDMAGSFQPDILIGIDYYWSFVSGECIHVPNGPVAMNTRLGWIVSGPMYGLAEEESTSLVTHVLKTSTSIEESNRKLERQLHKFWDLESVRIIDEERTVYEQFADMVQFREGRYEVLLPWKDSSVVIPDNYHLCVKRLYSLLRRLHQTPQLLKQYDDVIRQ